MVKISTIFALGILVVFVQFTGFPKGFKDFVYIVSGLAIAILSFLIRKELHKVLRHLHSDHVSTDTFSENSPINRM